MEHIKGLQPIVQLMSERMALQTRKSIRSSGQTACDIDEMSALQSRAQAMVRASAMPSFNPGASGSDEELFLQLKGSSERVVFLVAKREVLASRLLNLRERSDHPTRPARSQWLVKTCAISLFVLVVAPTVQRVFFDSVEDTLLAWLIALLIGAAVGAFICVVLLDVEEEPC